MLALSESGTNGIDSCVIPFGSPDGNSVPAVFSTEGLKRVGTSCSLVPGKSGRTAGNNESVESTLSEPGAVVFFAPLLADAFPPLSMGAQAAAGYELWSSAGTHWTDSAGPVRDNSALQISAKDASADSAEKICRAVLGKKLPGVPVV